jgi:hypothetical protein
MNETFIALWKLLYAIDSIILLQCQVYCKRYTLTTICTSKNKILCASE